MQEKRFENLLRSTFTQQALTLRYRQLILLAGNYEEVLNQHKSSRSKASEIENAIKHHIKINIDEDPEYYKKLSERLEDIIKSMMKSGMS